MLVSAIVAVASNNAIGRDNALPWHLPEDLKFFKRTTMGKPVLMGRKTFESLGRPLPGRLNIVLSSQKDLTLPEGVVLCHSLEEGLAQLKAAGNDEVFVIGGGKIFADCLPLLDRLYITRIEFQPDDADVFFPEIDSSKWKLVWEEPHQADERHAYNYTFQKYERIWR